MESVEGVNVPGLIELIKTGGDAGVLVLAIIGIAVAKKFLAALEKIVVTMQSQHEENRKDLESIKRAVIAKDPTLAPFFDRNG